MSSDDKSPFEMIGENAGASDASDTEAAAAPADPVEASAAPVVDGAEGALDAAQGDPEPAPTSPFEVIGETASPPHGADASAPSHSSSPNEPAPQTKQLGEYRGPTGPGGRKIRLPGLSSRAYEHPADRAALAGLRKVPGLDVVLRKFVALIGEKSLRYLFLANAVRVNERQFTKLFRTYLDCCKTLGIVDPPELYVAESPFINAGAIGVDQPFIVLNSATLSLLDDEEIRAVLGHELGHILSDHVLYKTMLGLLLNLSLSRLGIPLGNLALFGIISALREWDRKSELSSDRAGLLAVQNPQAAYTVHMKLAGGRDVAQMSLDEFVAQAEEYERAGGVIDGIYKLLNLLDKRHPFHVMRLLELKRWVESGAYEAVLSGDYPRREEDGSVSVLEEVKEGAAEYKEAYESSPDPLVRFFNDLGETVSETASNVLDSAKGLLGRMSGKK